MKKALLFIPLLAAGSSVIAQVKFVKPLDGPLYPQFNYQKDSSWRTLPMFKDSLQSTNYGLGRLNGHTNLMAAIKPTTKIIEAYNMPVTVLEGKSNMPIKKIEGFYTMPVVGSNMPKPQKLNKANP